MRKFNFIYSLYFLPVFFFTLAISPNINGDRIGMVLVSVLILLVPTTNYIAAKPQESKSGSASFKYTFIDLLSLLAFLLAIYIGYQISWQFNLLQVLYLLVVQLISRQETYPHGNLKQFSGWTLQGILLFAVIYIGLNQYGFNNLFRIHILLFAILNTITLITCSYISMLRKYKLAENTEVSFKHFKTILILLSLMVMLYAGFFISTYTWQYAGFFVLAITPSLILLLVLMKSTNVGQKVQSGSHLLWLNIILAISMTVFFIYFFLESTQVLQAIRGGY